MEELLAVLPLLFLCFHNQLETAGQVLHLLMAKRLKRKRHERRLRLRREVIIKDVFLHNSEHVSVSLC